MIIGYNPKIDEMRQKASSSQKDTSILDAIIDLYSLVNGQLDDANIAPNGITQNNLIAYNWVTPTMINSWVYYDNGGSVYNTPGYMKDSLGFVHLKGLIKSGTIGATVYTLPVGYRPAKNCIFAVGSNSTIGICYVLSNGEVQAMNGNNAWFSFDGITFKAVQ